MPTVSRNACCFLFKLQDSTAVHVHLHDETEPYHFAVDGKTFDVIRDKYPDLLPRV